jgi:hypothetical protein
VARDGWRPNPDLGPPFYTRSGARRLDVPGLLPLERTNRFDLPIPHVFRFRVRGVTRLRVTRGEGSVVVLDAPRNAIGDAFPAGISGPGPGHSTRVRLPVADFADSVEFDVRSRPFRNPIFVKAVSVTVWTPFGWLLGLAIPLISDRVRDVSLRWLKRGFQRYRLRRRARARATKAL